MATDLRTTATDHDQIRQWFGDLRQAGDEFEEFACDQLRQLESLGARIDDRQREIERGREEVHRQLVVVQESQRRLDDASATAEKCASDFRNLTNHLVSQSTHQQGEETEEKKRERERLHEGFELARSQAQSLAQTVTADLDHARAELTSAREDLAQERQRLSDAQAPLHDALASHLAELAKHRALAATAAVPEPAPAARQVSAVTERRAARSAPAAEIASTEEGDAKWRGELDRLRSGLVKTVAPRTKQRPAAKQAAADSAAGESSQKPPSSDDAVLNSVLAQFEMLQNDLVGRRARHRPAGPAPAGK